MKVMIEREECISCGACYADCPEVFEENEDDFFSQIVADYRADDQLGVGEVPDDLEDCVQAGIDGCPVEIISIE
ncbi:MAG: ferredoxin [Anaerolineae bacterium]|jgi:ferredoxin